MPLISKDMQIVGGVGIGCLLLGGALGYHISKGNTDNMHENPLIHKATSKHASALDKYVIDNSLREPQILNELHSYTAANVKMSVMLTDVVEAQLFRVLLKMLNASKCMEVGVYTGYNTLNMAISMPADGIVYALDISEDYVNHGKQFFEKARVSDKIDIRIGPAAESMEKLINEGHVGSFDFIFIDANKDGYDTYYEKGLMLLRTGGLIALDNTFQHGNVLDIAAVTDIRSKVAAEAIHKLNVKVCKDERVAVSMLKIADGVTLCLKL